MDLTLTTKADVAQSVAPAATITQSWAAFGRRIREEGLDAQVGGLARDRLIDAIATAIAARALPVPAVVRQFIGRSAGAATVIGSPTRADAIDAAFMNAVLVNGCSHDDFVAKSHPSAVTIPAALAVAEEEGGVSGSDLLASIVFGYELVARAYMAGPGMLPRFRASGVAGTFGAAAAAAHLMRLDEEEVAHALGLAAMFSSGFGEGFLSGTMDVKLNVGWACRSGVSAARLARCGATASPYVLEGPSGFYRAFSNAPADVRQATQGLGQGFLIEDTVYKERPVCIFVQTPVELARSLSEAHGLAACRIDRVRIRAPLATLTNPGYENVAPFGTALQARVSARFTVAAALLGRAVETYEYYDNVADAEVLALAQRIELLEPASETDVSVEVEAQGRTLQAAGAEMDHLRPAHDKVVAKYRRLTVSLAPSTSEHLLAMLLDIERLDDVAALGELLRGI